MVFALFCGRGDLAQALIDHSFLDRMEKQIAAGGSQPHELARTLSWNYSIFNLQAMLTAALVAERVGRDLVGWRGQHGQSLAMALLFLLDRAPGRESAWTWPQIKPRDHADERFQSFQALLERARLVFKKDAVMLSRIQA